MTEQEAIEALKHENEHCLSLCEAACESIKEYQCNCRDGVIERMIGELLQYRKIGTVEECREAVKKQKPIAFDKEKVSQELREVADLSVEDGLWHIELREAIEIVEKGGIE